MGAKSVFFFFTGKNIGAKIDCYFLADSKIGTKSESVRFNKLF